MAAMTDYLENKLIDYLFRGVAFTPPAALYVALFTAAPSDTGGGTEVTGGAYARQNLAPGVANWASTGGAGTTTNPSAGNTGTTSNNLIITWPKATANWGTITHAAIFDAATGGNMLYWGPMITSQLIAAEAVFSFPISQLSYQIDN